MPEASDPLNKLPVSGQRSRVMINFAKVSSDNVKDSSKYREVPLDIFRKDILISGCRVALCNQSAEQPGNENKPNLHKVRSSILTSL